MNRSTDIDALVEDWMTTDDIGPVRPEIVRSALDRARALDQHRPGLGGWRAFGLPRRLGWAARVTAIGLVVVTAAAVVRTGGLVPLGAGSGGGTDSASPAPSAVPVTPPLGLAIVGVDGVIRQDLGLPQDAWMPDLSADGSTVVFVTRDRRIAECGSCGEAQRVVAVGLGEPRGQFIHDGGSAGDSGAPVTELYQPALSPDGSMIAFQGVTGRQGNGWQSNRDIYAGPLLRGDHQWSVTLVRLTDDPAVDEFPAWSPDGTTIVYSNGGSEPLDSSGFSPTQEIWSVPVTGGTPTRLTTDEAADTMPDAAADGRVAWWHEGEVWTMAPDGSDQRRLLSFDGINVFNPVWSPDRTRIALLLYDPSERAPARPDLGRSLDLPLLEVIVVDVATKAITDTGIRVASDVNPVSWTPDGKALLVNRYDGGTQPGE